MAKETVQRQRVSMQQLTTWVPFMRGCKSPSALSSVAPLLISTWETPREQPEPGKQQTAAKDAVTMLPQPRHHLSQPVSLRHPKSRATATARRRRRKTEQESRTPCHQGPGLVSWLRNGQEQAPPALFQSLYQAE